MQQTAVLHPALPSRGHNSPPTVPRMPGLGTPSGPVPPARIYRPSKSAATSAPDRTRWVLEFDRVSPPFIEPLMGWTGSGDPFQPIRLAFPDLQSALDFAERQGWEYDLIDPAPRRQRPHPSRDPVYRQRTAISASRRASTPASIPCERPISRRASTRRA